MDEMRKGTVLYARSHIKVALLYNRRASARKRASGEHYRVDRSDAAHYLRGMPKWSEKIASYFETLKAARVPIVYVDVCGRANGTSLGADITYTFSLQPKRLSFWHGDEVHHIEGDLFSARDFGKFLRRLEDEVERPAFVTFEPIAGLQNYTPWRNAERTTAFFHEKVTWQRLENNLQRLIKVLRPGGYIYLDKPFQFATTDIRDFMRRIPRTHYESYRWLQQFVQNNGCTVELGVLLGNRYLIHKNDV